MAWLGVSVGHRFSFPKDTCGMAGLGRLPRANKAVKIKIRLVWDCFWQKRLVPGVRASMVDVSWVPLTGRMQPTFHAGDMEPAQVWCNSSAP